MLRCYLSVMAFFSVLEYLVRYRCYLVFLDVNEVFLDVSVRYTLPAPQKGRVPQKGSF